MQTLFEALLFLHAKSVVNWLSCRCIANADCCSPHVPWWDCALRERWELALYNLRIRFRNGCPDLLFTISAISGTMRQSLIELGYWSGLKESRNCSERNDCKKTFIYWRKKRGKRPTSFARLLQLAKPCIIFRVLWSNNYSFLHVNMSGTRNVKPRRTWRSNVPTSRTFHQFSGSFCIQYFLCWVFFLWGFPLQMS